MSLQSGVAVPYHVNVYINPGATIPAELGFVDMNTSPSTLPSILNTPIAHGAMVQCRNVGFTGATLNATSPDTIDGNASIFVSGQTSVKLIADYKTDQWHLICTCAIVNPPPPPP